MKVFFSHGKESGPWGSKITRLANIAKEYGCDVDSIDYTDTLDSKVRIERLVNILKNTDDDFLLVGSSMGGYISLVASQQVDAKALFLLAPALYMPGYVEDDFRNITNVEIVHGWSDDIIPVDNSFKFAKDNDCPLHLISGDHRLNSSLGVVEKLFAQFIKSQIFKKAY
ncbi:alpha/beta hydrolase [Shewanella olleyana]|uniref:YqiA/YcfP family alpha/beta fold hydrolase n=1 Tax=Shewanella olleyana TaxID=135626 RepID=UPI00200CCC50|nr:YqiA/YcfP family alpha/beta fold hydrolase [Shewanella olleyana]MCL1067220.1 alpha/beta hydrolase [Shewanella olleyana]